MTRVADVIVDVLVKAGAKRCYGVPGDTLNYFTDAVRRSKLRWIHVRHEEAGGMAAGADALLTNELALCAGACGPGSLHFINGLWESHRNRAPVVLIASQIVRDEIGFDFPQEVDFKAVYSKGTVFCEEIRTPSQARRMTAMAAQAALSRKGVAVLIVPVDVSRASAPDEPEFAVHRAAPVTWPSEAELNRIAAALNKGKQITIYGGSGCAGALDHVLALAERLKAPVARTSRAKDFLAHDNPYDVGMTGVFGTKGGFHAVLECDTLLLLGCDFAWRQFYPGRATIIQIDIDGAHLGRRHPVDIAVVGDIGPTLEALLPKIEVRNNRAFLDAVLNEAREAEAKLDRRAVPTDGTMHPQFVAETIAARAAVDAVYTADAGTPLGFVELEQKVEGLLDAYTDLRNPDFARVAEAIGMWGRRVEKSETLEDSVQAWLSAPGPALLDVVVARNELVMPPKIEASQVLGTVLYSAKAILAGRTDDVIDLAKGALVS